MDLISQIFWGSLVLFACTLVHIAVIALLVPELKPFADRVHKNFPKLRIVALTGIILAAIILAHTIQVWLWAASFVWLGALQDMDTAIYFSLITYTTVGYGDVTLPADFRIFGAFASITGLLMFGLSTALVVGVMTKILPKRLD